MYFVTTLSYEVGAVIPAGPLGRTLSEYGRLIPLPTGQSNVFGDGWRLLTEYVLEQIREEHYPDLPSRLTCSFAFPTLEIAKKNGHSVLAPSTPFARRIYAVELTNTNCIVHHSDMDIIPVRYGDNYMSRVFSEAHRYWCAPGDAHTPETLLGSDLRVIAIAEGQSESVRFDQAARLP